MYLFLVISLYEKKLAIEAQRNRGTKAGEERRKERKCVWARESVCVCVCMCVRETERRCEREEELE